MNPCQRCGEPAARKRRHAKYCQPCAKAVAYAQELKRRERRKTEGVPRTERCEVCGVKFTPSTPAKWDHNHDVNPRRGSYKGGRGWLCHHCNLGLGQLGDNPALLRRAAEYLETRGAAPTRSVLH